MEDKEYINGNLIRECYRKDGMLDGPYISYYEGTTKVSCRCFFVAGKKEGKYIYYHSNGKIAIECEYKNGKLDGSYRKYMENGDLIEAVLYENGDEKGPLVEIKKTEQTKKVIFAE